MSTSKTITALEAIDALVSAGTIDALTALDRANLIADQLTPEEAACIGKRDGLSDGVNYRHQPSLAAPESRSAYDFALVTATGLKTMRAREARVLAARAA